MSIPQRQIFAPPPFEVVFAEQNRFVWRLLVRLGVQARDAADVCQEVFLVVHRRLPEFDPGQSALRTWVSGICLRAASEYRRRNPSRREVLGQELEPSTHASGPDAALEAQRAWQALSRVLDAMDVAKRQVFVLYELEAISMPEIVDIVGCPLQTAYSRLHAARRLVLSAFGAGEEP